MLRKPKEWLFVLTSAVAFRERETEAADSAAEAAAAEHARELVAQSMLAAAELNGGAERHASSLAAASDALTVAAQFAERERAAIHHKMTRSSDEEGTSAMAAIQDTVAEVQAASDEGLVDVAGPDPSLHAPRVLPDSEVHTESRLDAAQSLGQMLQPKVAANSARLRRIVSDAPPAVARALDALDARRQPRPLRGPPPTHGSEAEALLKAEVRLRVERTAEPALPHHAPRTLTSSLLSLCASDSLSSRRSASRTRRRSARRRPGAPRLRVRCSRQRRRCATAAALGQALARARFGGRFVPARRRRRGRVRRARNCAPATRRFSYPTSQRNSDVWELSTRRQCARAHASAHPLRFACAPFGPIREARSSSLSLADVRRSCRYASGADVAALRTGAMQSSQATHADELADRQTASTRRAARRSEHFAEISAGSGEDDKLIGTLRLCAARAQKEAASAPLAMLHDRLDRSAEAKARRALLLEGGRAEQWARAQAILSKTHLADAGRLKALRTRQRAAVHTIRTAAVAAKRPRVGEAEVDARLVRSLAVPTAIGLEASPLQLQATGQEASAARQDALGETSTADMEGDETDPRASMPLTPRPATLAQSALRQLEDFRNGLPRAHFISALRRTPSLLMPPDGERAPASSLSSSEGSAILLAPRASAGAVGLATRLMRVVDSGDVVQAEPSSGEKAASIVSFLKKSAMATKEQAVERHRKMHDTQRDALCAEVTARKQRERYPAHEVADTEIGRNLSDTRARHAAEQLAGEVRSSSTLREARMRRTHAVAAAAAAEPPTVTDDVAARWLQTLASLRAN